MGCRTSSTPVLSTIMDGNAHLTFYRAPSGALVFGGACVHMHGPSTTFTTSHRRWGQPRQPILNSVVADSYGPVKATSTATVNVFPIWAFSPQTADDLMPASHQRTSGLGFENHKRCKYAASAGSW